MKAFQKGKVPLANRGQVHRKRRKMAKFSPDMKKKLLVVFSAIVALSIGLVGRLIYIDQVKGEEYEKQVLGQQSYGSEAIPYQRGEILDTKGTVLATNVDVYNIVLDCKLINDDAEKYLDPTLKALTECFPDITEQEVKKALTEQADSRYFVLRKKLPYEAIEEFLELQAKKNKKGKKVNPNIQGVWFEKEYKRQYPYSTLASKVLGFTTSGNEGIGGLEDYYNDTLNGIDGRQYGYLNSDNNLEKTTKEPVNGNSLITTIDLNIQKIIEQNIAQFQEEHKDGEVTGAGSHHTGVLVLNPQNGEILGMSDNYTYDLNDPWDLTRFYPEEKVKKFSEKKRLKTLNAIWQNFCITYTYEPGSTVKPFTVATGLETGKLKETYECDGVEQIGGHEIKCINRSGHGTETIEKSLMDSCNDALMQMGMDIGKEDFYKYQNIFHFGLKTNIDLPGEARTDSLIYTVDNTNMTSLATNSFGQNFNVTMVQLASAFASLINGGYYYQPHLVRRIVDEYGNTVQSVETSPLKQTISKQTSDMIKGYLYKTVSEGTGKSAKVPGYSMGGKTGTAQKGKREDRKYVVSFIGFAPVEDPQVLVYVVIDEANVAEDDQSSALATAVAKKIFEEILPYMNIFPDEDNVTPDGETEDPQGAGEAANPQGAQAPGTDGQQAAEDGQGAQDPSADGQQGEGATEGSQGDQEPAGDEPPPEGTPNAMPDGGDGIPQEPEDLLDGMTPEEYP